jgi:hypothetical protein
MRRKLLPMHESGIGPTRTCGHFRFRAAV